MTDETPASAVSAPSSEKTDSEWVPEGVGALGCFETVPGSLRQSLPRKSKGRNESLRSIYVLTKSTAEETTEEKEKTKTTTVMLQNKKSVSRKVKHTEDKENDYVAPRRSQRINNMENNGEDNCLSIYPVPSASTSSTTVKKLPSKVPRGLKYKRNHTEGDQYRDEEKAIIFADKRFVIEAVDIGKEFYEAAIWQIEETTRSLRKFYPAHYIPKPQRSGPGSVKHPWYRTFHCGTQLRLQFSEKEFRSPEFYQRFQPIVVIIAKEEDVTLKVNSEGSDEKMSESTDMIVQFVYIDKAFFKRMIKFIGKIHLTENLRENFIEALRLYVMLAVSPSFLADRDKGRLGRNTIQKFRKILEAWDVISHFIKEKLVANSGHYGFNQKLFKYLVTFPNYQSSEVATDAKNRICSACCKEKTQIFSFVFTTKEENEKSYNRKTLQNLPRNEKPAIKLPANGVILCKTCAESARILHRLMHYQHGLLQLKRRNVALEIRSLLSKNKDLKVTDAILLWSHDIDKSWQNKMFLDFQVIVAEVDSIRINFG